MMHIIYGHGYIKLPEETRINSDEGSGIRDLAYFRAGIRDFEGKGARDSGLWFWPGQEI